MKLADTKDSIFGTWGIEEGIYIPELDGSYNVANTIRACFDLIDAKIFYQASCMNKDYIANDKYDDIVIEKEYELKAIKTQEEWDRIDTFMRKEYLLKWVNFNNDKNV